MKRFVAGIVVGVLLTLAGAAVAAPGPIKLILNGKELSCQPTPRLIDGSVFVPVRFVSEALGARVQWKPEMNAVEITTNTLGGNAVAQGVLTINGVKTGATKWIDDSQGLYMPGRLLVEAIAAIYPDVTLAIDGTLSLGGKKVKLDCRSLDGAPLYSLDAAAKAGLLRYTWDRSTSSLQITRQ